MERKTQSSPYEEYASLRIDEGIEAARMLKLSAGDIARAGVMLAGVLAGGGKVLLFGNGGSAADAQHIAGELVGKFMLERKALPALCLSSNSSVMTAVANDSGYENVFSRQVEALGKEGDAAVALSTSGESPNVLRGLEKAAASGMRTLALTGSPGGAIARTAEMALVCPSGNTPVVQQLHIACGHIICGIIERFLFER